MEDIENLFNNLAKIEYGWYDKNNNLHEEIKNSNFKDDYRMQDIKKIKNHAICWELCEVERNYFKEKKIPFMTLFALVILNHKYYCHTFSVFKFENKYYWFEASWKQMKGIRKYNDLNSLLTDVKDNFYDFTCTKDYNKEQIRFYKYHKPLKHIKCNPFYYNAMILGKKIKSNETL